MWMAAKKASSGSEVYFSALVFSSLPVRFEMHTTHTMIIADRNRIADGYFALPTQN